MSTVIEAVDVDVPVGTAYNQWDPIRNVRDPSHAHTI